MRWLDFSSPHLNLAIPTTNQALRNVDGIAVILRITEEDIDDIFCSGVADDIHFRRIEFQRVLDVLRPEHEIYCSSPAAQELVSTAHGQQ